MMNSKRCYHILHSKGTNYNQIRLKGVIRLSFVKVVGGKNLNLNVLLITETTAHSFHFQCDLLIFMPYLTILAFSACQMHFLLFANAHCIGQVVVSERVAGLPISLHLLCVKLLIGLLLQMENVFMGLIAELMGLLRERGTHLQSTENTFHTLQMGFIRARCTRLDTATI